MQRSTDIDIFKPAAADRQLIAVQMLSRPSHTIHLQFPRSRQCKQRRCGCRNCSPASRSRFYPKLRRLQHRSAGKDNTCALVSAVRTYGYRPRRCRRNKRAEIHIVKLCYLRRTVNRNRGSDRYRPLAVRTNSATGIGSRRAIPGNGDFSAEIQKKRQPALWERHTEYQPAA